MKDIVVCCDCDEEIPLEDAHKIKIEGLDKNFLYMHRLLALGT